MDYIVKLYFLIDQLSFGFTDFFSNTILRLSLSLLWRSKSGRTSDSRAAVLLSECASKTSPNVDLVCLLLCISLEGPGCSSGRGCSWELVACAIEDFGTVVLDEVVLNRS